MKHSQKYFVGQQTCLEMVNGQVEEIYGGHNIIKAFNKEEEVIEVFNETNDKLYDSRMEISVLLVDDACNAVCRKLGVMRQWQSLGDI